MSKLVTLEKIRWSRIVAIIREEDPDVAFKAASACIEGGLTCVEIAMTTPLALDIVESLAKIEGVTVGAGTVLDAETATACIQVGAAFLLSPAVVPDMIRVCSRRGVVSVPGAFTATEVLAALEAGADIVKIFPASAVGPQYIQSLAAPLPQAIFMPSGGVSVENLSTWFVNGVTAVGVGATLTAGAACGDYDAVRARAQVFATAVQSLRQTAAALPPGQAIGRLQ